MMHEELRTKRRKREEKKRPKEEHTLKIGLKKPVTSA
jgi:hypothetical protein